MSAGVNEPIALVLPTEGYPSAGPAMWYPTTMLRWRGFEVVVDGQTSGIAPIVVVAMGDRCGLYASTPGMFIAPDLNDPKVMDGLAANPGPVLLIGSSDFPGWSQAAAARLRTVEILQLTGVDRNLERAGDVSGSLAVIGKVLGRFGALLDRV